MTIEEIQQRVTQMQQLVLQGERKVATTQAELAEVERQLVKCVEQANQLGVTTISELDAEIEKLSKELEVELSSITSTIS